MKRHSAALVFAVRGGGESIRQHGDALTAVTLGELAEEAANVCLRAADAPRE